MSDLSERLALEAQERSKADYQGIVWAPGMIDLLTEAADEIARLEQWVDDLQGRMYINCVYCGHRYGPEDDEAEHETMREELHAHVEQCPKHPMSEMKRQRDEARQKLHEAQEDIDALQGDLNEIATQFGIELLGVGLRAKLHGLALGMRGQLDEARRELARTREMLKQVLTDWVHSYAPQECHEADVAITRERIRSAGGTLAYIADINGELHAALAKEKANEPDR